MKKRTQTSERPRRRADSLTNKRTQTGGVNGPYNGRNRRKGKSDATRQSDAATFDSTLPDE
jgi:hypothetical protein